MSELRAVVDDGGRASALEKHGYTSVMAVASAAPPKLATALDISEPEAIDLKQSARKHISLNGFTTALRANMDLDLHDVSISEPPVGWELHSQSSVAVEWISDGGYELSVVPESYGSGESLSFVVRGPVARKELHREHLRNGVEQRVLYCGVESVLEAVSLAEQELERREMLLMDELTSFRGVGVQTAAYLQLRYGISSKDDIVSIWDSGVLGKVVSPEYFHELSEVFESY